MNLILHFFLAVALLVFVGCSKNESFSTKPISTENRIATQQELVERKGLPQGVSKEGNNEIYQYADQEKFLIEEGKVFMHARNPVGDEAKLQYWRHLWRGQAYSEEDHAGVKMLIHTSSGTQVLYQPKEDRVQRVYEK